MLCTILSVVFAPLLFVLRFVAWYMDPKHPVAAAVKGRAAPDPRFFPQYFMNQQNLWLYWKQWRPIATLDAAAAISPKPSTNPRSRVASALVPRGLVFLVQGFGEHTARYDSIAAKLTGEGYWVYCHDHQGQGTSEGARRHVERFDDFVNDTLQFCDERVAAAEKEIDANKALLANLGLTQDAFGADDDAKAQREQVLWRLRHDAVFAAAAEEAARLRTEDALGNAAAIVEQERIMAAREAELVSSSECTGGSAQQPPAAAQSAPIENGEGTARPGLKVVIMGHSMGGLIASHCAFRRPEYFDRVILSSPALGTNDPLASIKPIVFALSYLAEVLPKVPLPGIPADLLSFNKQVIDLAQSDTSMGPPVMRLRWAAEMTQSMARANLWAKQERRFPTFLVVHSVKDEVCPAIPSLHFSDYLGRGGHHGRLLTYDSGLHEMFTDPKCAKKVYRDVVGFLNGDSGPQY